MRVLPGLGRPTLQADVLAPCTRAHWLWRLQHVGFSRDAGQWGTPDPVFPGIGLCEGGTDRSEIRRQMGRWEIQHCWERQNAFPREDSAVLLRLSADCMRPTQSLASITANMPVNCLPSEQHLGQCLTEQLVVIPHHVDV